MRRASARCCCPYDLKVDSVGLLNNASHGVYVCVVGTPFGLGCWERSLSSSRADRRDTLFARRLQVVIQVGKRFLMLDGQECCDWRRTAGSEIPQCGARRLDERPGWAGRASWLGSAFSTLQRSLSAHCCPWLRARHGWMGLSALDGRVRVSKARRTLAANSHLLPSSPNPEVAR